MTEDPDESPFKYPPPRPPASSGDERFRKLRVSTDEQALRWRFHRGSDQRWRWEKIAADRSVVAQSNTSFASYPECLTDAGAHGYKHPPSPPGLQEPR